MSSHLTSSYKHHSDLMGVIRRHLVQDLHSSVDHLPEREDVVNYQCTQSRWPLHPHVANAYIDIRYFNHIVLIISPVH